LLGQFTIRERANCSKCNHKTNRAWQKTQRRQRRFPISMEAFSRLAPRQKVIGMVGVALLLAVLIGGWLWTKDPPYSLLFAIQDEKDGGQIVAALQQQNVPYRFSDGGHTILVPQAVVHDTRLKLAAQGLPKGGLVGFELLENAENGHQPVRRAGELPARPRRRTGPLDPIAGRRQGRSCASGDPEADRLPARRPEGLGLGPGESRTPAARWSRPRSPASSTWWHPACRSSTPKNVSVIDQEGKLISQQRDPSRDAGLDARAAQVRARSRGGLQQAHRGDPGAAGRFAQCSCASDGGPRFLANRPGRGNLQAESDPGYRDPQPADRGSRCRLAHRPPVFREH
jgi:hypothetical protein